ncbi:C45 family peptidase [Microgenomates group bacterium]|nr:C45 family peptidase [Microgenomates group bacterium]
MCTTAAKKLDNSWFLIKTRDPVSWMRWDDEIKLFNAPADKFKKLIIQNPDPYEDGYYGGINDQGVAIVATYVHVAENQISYIRRPYIRLILDVATAKEAVEMTKAFNPRIGGNMFVADKNQCFGIEAAPEKYFFEKIAKPAVKTNHFLHLPNRNLGFDTSPTEEQWSKTHQARAEELIKAAHNLEDLQNILKDRQNSDKKMAICTTPEEEKCYTHSAFIFDTKNVKAYYSQGCPLTTPFKEYNFTDKKSTI